MRERQSETDGRTASAERHKVSVNTWMFQSGQVEAVSELSALPQRAANDNLVWVDLTNYAPRDLNQVSATLHVPASARLAILSPWQAPRYDVYESCSLVTLLIAWVDPSIFQVQTSKLDVLVGKNFVVTAHKLPLPFLDRVLVRAQSRNVSTPITPTYLLYSILDGLLLHYEALTDHLEDEVEQMFEQVLRASSATCLEVLLRLKRYVLALVRHVDHHRLVFTSFTRPGSPLVSSKEDESYFKDIQGHLAYVVDRLSVTRESVNSAFDIHVSHVSYLTSVALQVLTVVSVLLLPATLLVALSGVFFQYLSIPQPEGLAIMVVTIGFLTSMIYILLRRHGWA